MWTNLVLSQFTTEIWLISRLRFSLWTLWFKYFYLLKISTSEFTERFAAQREEMLNDKIVAAQREEIKMNLYNKDVFRTPEL